MAYSYYDASWSRTATTTTKWTAPPGTSPRQLARTVAAKWSCLCSTGQWPRATSVTSTPESRPSESICQMDTCYITYFIQTHHPYNYAAFVSKPMDWETCHCHLKNCNYETIGQVVANLHLIFANSKSTTFVPATRTRCSERPTTWPLS